MEEKFIKKEKNRQKKRRISHKILFVVWISFLLFFWWFNHYCTVKGVPGWLLNCIATPLEKSGYQLKAEQVFFNFTDGIRINELNYYSRNSGIRLYAPELYIDIHPLRIFKGVSCPVEITVRNASATLPMIPEAGVEGKKDCLDIANINAEINGEKGCFSVEEASAKLGNISVRMNGSVNNLLHIIAENIMAEYWEKDKSGKKRKIRKYPYGIMQIFPIDIRKKFMLTYRQIEQIKIKAPIECDIKFNIDVNDFKNCEINSEIQLPEFQFNNLKVCGIKEQISLKNGVLRLNEVTFDFGNGASITAAGTYYDEKNMFSGKMKGDCQITDLMNFTNSTLSDDIRKHVVFSNQKVTFHGILEHFSVSGDRYKGKIDLTLPEITVNGIVMKNVKLHVRVDEKRLYGEILHAEINGCNVTGSLTLDESGEILCKMQGKAYLKTFQKAFPEEAQKFIEKKVTFLKPESPIDFSGKLRIDTRRKNRYSGQVSLKYSHICLNGIEIQDIEGEMEFSAEEIHFSKISAKTSDGSVSSGSLQFDLQKQHITAKIITSGIPVNLAKSFDTIWQTDSLMPLAKDISSTDPKGVAETDMVLFADYGEKPFYQICGNVVMRNPTYMGIPFQYGAARFITDSTDKVIIPELILKTKDNYMRLNSIYFLKEDKTGEETLYFDLDSTIKGNDLLTIFGEGYKPELVDFPFPVDVKAKGVINYTKVKKTTMKVDIKNGSCTFAGAKVTDIDTVVHFKDDIISFTNADMAFCKGVCKVDFNYDFETEKGSFKQTLEGADLFETIKEFKSSQILPKGTGNGKVNFDSKGTFEYKSDNTLLINGKGELRLFGKELWNIPILNDFLKYITGAWSILGDEPGITEISSDILFKGEKAVISDVRANGSIVSIDADGEFSWNTGMYDITVQGILLKSALPFNAASTVLKPISWMLKKNFKGKYTLSQQPQEK